MLEKIKRELRISNTAYDEDIQDSIDAAIADMILAGITSEKANDISDPLIMRAIKTFCKGEFGLNNPNSKNFMEAYESLRNHLSMSAEYNGGDINAI